MSTHKDDHDSDATAKRDSLFGKELVYDILAIVVLGVLYIMIRIIWIVEHVMRLNENIIQLNEHVMLLKKYAIRLKERGWQCQHMNPLNFIKMNV
jgi:hypothetical protein